MHDFYAKTGPVQPAMVPIASRLYWGIVTASIPHFGRATLMRLTIEIIAALLFLVFISASSAAFAAGKFGRGADGVSRGFILPQNAAARCAAIRGQCGGKFYANYCGDRMLTVM
jgi:hypothetical protein